MNLSTFARLATSFYESGKCIYLRSAPGRGKTTVVSSLPAIIGEKLGKHLGFSLVNGPNLTPGDTIGWGMPRHHENGRSEMTFTLPFFWKTEEGKYLEEYDGGIIFIDEADKMDIDIKKVMGEMALSGRAGIHKLPPGWVVWMAGNRSGDRSGSTKELDHLINRRFEIDVTDDIVGWEQWAHKNHVPPAIIAFAVGNPQIVFPDKLPEKQGPFCTPRSLVSVGDVLVTMAGNEGKLPTDTDAVEVASAGIGDAAAAQLFATIRLEDELPALATIIAAPTTAKVPAKPDAQMLVCYKLASVTDEKNIEPIVKYIGRLPTDFAATYCKSAITRNPRLLTTPAIMAWAKNNAALLAIISQLK